MPTETRPIRNRQEFFTAYSRWLSGDSQGQIYNYFNDTPHYRRVGLRTVTTWVSWFRQTPQEEQEKDKPFYFHNMDKYDIPWTAYEEVLELVRRYAKEQDEELTARQAKWVWRLIQIGSFRSQLGRPRVRVSSLMKLTNRYIAHEHEALFKLPLTESLESISESVEREIVGVNNVT